MKNKRNVPTPRQMEYVHESFGILALKYGTKTYRKDRKRADRVVRKHLSKYGITGTSVERYLYLLGLNVLYGYEEVWLDSETRRKLQKFVKARRSEKDSSKSRQKDKKKSVKHRK